jgi:hypothetical protein
MRRRLTESEKRILIEAARIKRRLNEMADLSRFEDPVEVVAERIRREIVSGKHQNLAGMDLSGLDLRKARLREADLTGANLQGANLRGADLYYAEIAGANVQDADLAGAAMPDKFWEVVVGKPKLMPTDYSPHLGDHRYPIYSR